MDVWMRRIATVCVILAVPVVLVAVVVGVSVFLAVQPKDGDDLADARATSIADGLAASIGRTVESIDAETIAAERFAGSDAATVVPVAWSGTTGPGDRAVVDVRIGVAVSASTSGALFGPSNSAGSAEQCHRYTVVLLEETTHQRLSCDELPVSAASPSSHRPVFPDDAAQRVESVLAESHAGEEAESLRARFPGPGIVVDTVVTGAGETVVAVGMPATRDCVLRVRQAAGEISAPAYDRIWLEPGELGCSVELYTSPPR